MRLELGLRLGLGLRLRTLSGRSQGLGLGLGLARRVADRRPGEDHVLTVGAAARAVERHEYLARLRVVRVWARVSGQGWG